MNLTGMAESLPTTDCCGWSCQLPGVNSGKGTALLALELKGGTKNDPTTSMSF